MDLRDSVCYLMRKTGYLVDVAENGVEALEKVRIHRPDAVFLDLMMPVMDGISFLEACRKEFDGLPFPVVIMSATPDTRCDVLGVAGYLQKPFGAADAIAIAKRVTLSGMTKAVSSQVANTA
jgi:two-component system, chemotaxis family, chemotaxis protein CheY